jgi:hypothetical protein
MVRFLLLPEDEAEFLAWAQVEHGLELATSVAEASGLSRLERLTECPVALPGPPVPGSSSPVPDEFLLRRPDWGVNDLEPWEADTAVGRVMRNLNEEAAERVGVSIDNLIDFERTRVIRFRRCGWTQDGELHVAALQGSARPARLQDPTVASTLKSVQRWLVRGSVRVELAAEIRYRPRILARPRAHAWVLSGGPVYPWDA